MRTRQTLLVSFLLAALVGVGCGGAGKGEAAKAPVEEKGILNTEILAVGLPTNTPFALLVVGFENTSDTKIVRLASAKDVGEKIKIVDEFGNHYPPANSNNFAWNGQNPVNIAIEPIGCVTINYHFQKPVNKATRLEITIPSPQEGVASAVQKTINLKADTVTIHKIAVPVLFANPKFYDWAKKVELH